MKEKARAVRRQHVLDAAIIVFAAKGFRGATIRDIAIEAGVSDGTIYNLFDNKAALLHAILAGAKPTEPTMDLANSPSLPDLLRARWTAIGPDTLSMLRAILSEALIHPDFRDLYRHTLLSPAIDQLTGVLTHHPGQISDADSAPYDARLLTAVFMGLVMLRLLGDETTERGSEVLLQRLSAFVEHGLSRPVTKSEQS